MNLQNLDTNTLLLGIIAALIGVIAFKIDFNLNQFLETNRKYRKERLKRELQSTCTHVEFDTFKDGDGQPQFTYQPLFFTVPGTLNYYCRRCGLVDPCFDFAQESKRCEGLFQWFVKNPKGYNQKVKRLNRLINKYNRI